MLKRNQAASAADLNIGDRFYKTSDKKKSILEVVEITGILVCLPIEHITAVNVRLYSVLIKPGEAVIFLRSTT